MARVILCIPNFSEGRNQDVLDAISRSISETPGCFLLDVSAGQSTNRSVYTFAGAPDAVVLGALNSARVAHQLIDMSKHEGEHPAVGAMDVCPFVPVANVTMDNCVQCSNEFAKKLAEELNVPVYLYEYSSQRSYRKSLPDIREGEYKGLPKKLTEAGWEPDYGPSKFVPSWGATVTGARDYLVAYNVNLLGTKQQAHRIALNIREAGRGPKEPGILKHCRAIGWYLEEKDIAQVSINLTCPSVTSLHMAYEECVKQAKILNLPVIGSEIVGLVSLQIMLAAADYYIHKENLFIVREHQKIRLAVDRLGLNQLDAFDPAEKIIEYKMSLRKDGRLVGASVRQFVELVSARSSTPGGGSVSACIAAMGAALGTMVGWMTYGYKKFESIDTEMRQAISPLNDATQRLLPLIDMDSEAYASYVEATKLPQKTKEEKIKRNEAMDLGLKKAVDVPMSIIRTANQCWPHLISLAEHGNISCKSDLQVGCKALLTGMHGALLNVKINMKSIKDQDYCSKTLAEAEDSMQMAEMQCASVFTKLEER